MPRVGAGIAKGLPPPKRAVSVAQSALTAIAASKGFRRKYSAQAPYGGCH